MYRPTTIKSLLLSTSPFCACFFVRLEGRFSVPACVLGSAARSGGQDWPQAIAGGGAKRSLTAASTVRGSFGAGLSVPLEKRGQITVEMPEWN